MLYAIIRKNKGNIMENENYTIALLIDTDNVSAKYMDALDKELIVLGNVTHRRMYGDFTQNYSAGWKDIVNKFSITPVQQFCYTTGKNATDSKMVIDAMDILYSGNVNAFCIMSSDSDFTSLAKRLRESNMFVIGAGESKTPNSFVKSCDRFFLLDQIVKTEKKTENTPIKENKKASNKNDNVKADELNEEQSVSMCTKEEVEEFAIKVLEELNGKPYALAALMSKIYQAYPQFNYRNFGAKKAFDFFSKNKFTITKGKTTDMLISLKTN